MTAAQQKFVETIAPLIVAEGKKRGYKIFSTVIAQAVIESNYGASKLSASYHNYFGLKCGSYWKGASVNMKTKEEYTVGNLTTIKDNFRAYSDMASGVAGYYDFISTTRYSNLKSASSYKQYAERLKADGYATSSTYVNTLCNTVTKLGLEKYDTLDDVVCTDSSTVVDNSENLSTFEVGNVYTTTVNLNVRKGPGTGYAVAKTYKTGTRFTCKEISGVWLRTPSGWVCAEAGGKKYVK